MSSTADPVRLMPSASARTRRGAGRATADVVQVAPGVDLLVAALRARRLPTGTGSRSAAT